MVKLARHLQALLSPFSMALVLGLLVPIVALLWFMLRSVDNEREVVHSKLEELYRVDIQRQITLWLDEWTQEVEKAEFLASSVAPWSAFQQLAQHNRFSAVVVMDENQNPIFPLQAEPALDNLSRPAEVIRAEQLEFVEKNYEAARDAYLEFAQLLPNNALHVNLLAAAARCDWRLGNSQAAIERYLAIARLDRTEDNSRLDGEVVAALVRALELLATDVSRSTQNPEFSELLAKVQLYLNDYETNLMGSRKRLYLQAKVKSLVGENQQTSLWPIFRFETLANDLIDGNRLAKTWQKISFGEDNVTLVQLQHKNSGSRLRLFVDVQSQQRNLQSRFDELFGTQTTRVELANLPFSLTPKTLVHQALPAPLQNVYIDVSWLDDEILKRSASARATAFIITGWAVIGFLCLSAVFIYRHFHQQHRLGQLKNDAISTIAHELKTPLTSVRILLDNLIDKRARADQQTREYIEIISQEHDRLASLVDNFLTFSRLERGRFTSYRELLNIQNLVREALHLADTKIRQYAMQVEVDIATDEILVHADKSLLLTVLLNLLDNACKYSEAPRFVAVKVGLQQHFAEISIRDKGIGLSKKHLTRIFEQYYRVDPHLNSSTEGCGLGLHIAREIVLAHGGDITVQSAIGEGSTFIIRLPIAEGKINGN